MQKLTRHDDGDLTELQLDRPDRSNAIDGELLLALSQTLESPLGRVVVLAGRGDGAFCGGADRSLPDAERARLSDDLYGLYDTIVASDSIFICAVSGAAVGAGAQLAMACDVRIAAPAAFFRFAGPGHGLAVGTWALPSLVGRGRALELCLSMRDLPASEAERIGLVDRLSERPREASRELAQSILDLDNDARPRLKRLVAEAAGIREAMRRERSANAGWVGSLAVRFPGAGDP